MKQSRRNLMIKTDQKETYVQLILGIKNPAVLISEIGNVVECNDALLDLYNLRKMDFLGKNYFTSLKHHKIELPFASLEAMNNSSGCRMTSNRHQRGKNPSVIQWTASSVAINYKNNFVIIGSDVTLLINSKAKERKINQSIIDLIPNHFIFWKDINSVYLGCNDALAKSLGLSSSLEIIGKTDYDLSTTKEQNDSYRTDDLEVMRTKRSKLNIEELQRLPDGSEQILLTSKTPLFDEQGDVFGILAIYSDITERKKQEENLKQALESTEAANYIMTEFIANMGHDLATPITDVGSIAQILHCYSNEYPELSEFFEMLLARSEACEKVRKSIINATCVSNLGIRLETFSISKELLILEKELRPSIGSKNLKLVIHPLKPKKEDLIESDREKFHNILSDLISNAINFTKEGEVTVSVSKKNDFFHIKVSDTGIGIPSDKFDYIFGQYTKLSRSNKHGTDFKGVGAGLYLAKIRANLLKATISVESKINRGSNFTLSIPCHYSHKTDK